MSYRKTLTTKFATEGSQQLNSPENINFNPLIHRKLFESTIKLSEVFLLNTIWRAHNNLLLQHFDLNQQDKIQF